MNNTWQIKIKGNVTITAPATLENMTTCVLLEQEDWFEDEMQLIRRITMSGMNCLDIGACYGVYAKTMAQAAAKVYAFEPGPEVTEYLNSNKPDNLEVISKALSDKPGKASLSQSPPELCKTTQGSDFERITLDNWWNEAGKPQIDIIKLDVNGHEPQVLQGGRDFLTQSSALIIFSAASAEQSMTVLNDLGYEIYRYLPGPDHIVPYSEAKKDQYLLNLIAARPETAEQLSASTQINVNWQNYLGSLPWTREFMPTWQNAGFNYLQALDQLCSGRYEQAVAGLVKIFSQGSPQPSIVVSLSRALYMVGERRRAVQMLEQLSQATQQGQELNFNLPFLPPMPEQDQIPVKESSVEWVKARCMEACVKLRAFSGYFTGDKDLQLLRTIHQNPERLIESERRLALCAMRMGKNIQIRPESRLLTDEHLNAGVWAEIGGGIPNQAENNVKKDEISRNRKTSSEAEKQHFWDKIQVAQAKNDRATYCIELEKYLGKNPDDIKALSMLTNYYWSIWLPDNYQVQLINKAARYVKKEHDRNTELNNVFQKIQILTLRKKGVEIGRQKLAKYENIHRGERCVIIGNGPSLNKMDLSFLKNEYTFGMNRIYLGFDKFDFHPTYHICVNPAMLQQSGREMLEKVKCPKFFHFEAIPTLKPDDDVIYLNCRKTMSIFHTDPRHGTNFGSTVTHGALQLAYFMGFQEVILIGVDHYFATKGQPHKLIESQGDDPNHFDPTYFGKGYKWQLPDLENSEVAYRAAKYHYESVGRRIIDATLDGHCQVFGKVDYRVHFDLNVNHDNFILGPMSRTDSVSIDETKAIAETLLPKINNGVMIDVGAHFGTSLIHFLNNNWTILAFEPDSNNYKRLKSNIDKHPNKTRVHIDRRAVGNQKQKNVPFYVSEESTGISTLSKFHQSHIDNQNVDIVTLQNALEKFDFPHIDFLKIDTEGHDLFVLQGLPWDKYKPTIIECEFENLKTLNVSPPYTVNDLADFLLEKGYKLLVSEWHPIIRYGIRHDWNRLSRYDSRQDLDKSWGNIIAFTDSNHENEFILNLKNQFYSMPDKNDIDNSHKRSHHNIINIVNSDILTIENLLSRYIHTQGKKLQSVIDGGAGQGTFLQDICKHFDNDCKIFAVEPFPGNLDMLNKNISQDSRIKLYPYALSINEDHRYFFNPKTINEDSTWGRKGFAGCSNIGRLISEQEAQNILRNTQQSSGDLFVNKIACTTIDSIIKNYEINNLDLLKLDLQGGEYDALLGAKHSINNISLIWMEIINDLRPLLLLSNQGFSIMDTLYVFPEKSENILSFNDNFRIITKKISSVDTVYVFAERKFKWKNIIEEWPQIKKKFGMIQTDFIGINSNIANDIIQSTNPERERERERERELSNTVKAVKHHIIPANEHINSNGKHFHENLITAANINRANNEKLLSIAIPTYCRPNELKHCLSKFIEQISGKYEDFIEIIITDNCSPIECYNEVSEFIRNYKFIYSHRNLQTFNIEQNIKLCAEKCTGKYLWIFGDDDYIEDKNAINCILNILSTSEYEFLVLNKTRKNKNLSVSLTNNWMNLDCNKVYPFDGLRSFCKTFGLISVLGFISANIFDRKKYANIDISKYFNTYYPHVGAFMEAFHSSKVLLIGKPFICHRTISSQEKISDLATRPVDEDFSKNEFLRNQKHHSFSWILMLEKLINLGVFSYDDILQLKENTICNGLLIDFIFKHLKNNIYFENQPSDVKNSVKKFFKNLNLEHNQN
ncbi:FkbM family methyltransferase [Desulfonatronovibrio magnus]|uniref:FkbM family methyltransferase n=1 Tax=Desulfonatronovibrio magnus TaxID=698827 RepID=UPI000A017F48|nr:FkbM family methyltransferase [Desulfonatronovibrio magnus]